jgi:putative ATPase
MRPTAEHPERLVGAAAKLWNREFSTWRSENRFHAVLWGPPGSGKTTLARLLGESTGLRFTALSAVRDGVKDIRAAASSAPGQLLFIDEIHRLTKSQQDVLLPILEYAEAWVVGATTESPQVSLNPAILSRIRTLYVAPPTHADVARALQEGIKALENERQARGAGPFPQERRQRLHDLANDAIPKAASGDVRFALNLLETLAGCEGSNAHEVAAQETEIFHNLHKAYTEKGHADFASAMIKSMRGSDPDAALYYAISALDEGEDPLFILRRCVIFASEDVGNADLNALQVAVNAYRAVECVGMPEGRIALAQAVTYLAGTVKSNRAYKAIEVVRDWKRQAEARVQDPSLLVPPKELRLAGKESYQYPHDFPGAFVAFEYLPPAVAAVRRAQGPAYLPSDVGVEKRLRERLASLWDTTPKGTK